MRRNHGAGHKSWPTVRSGSTPRASQSRLRRTLTSIGSGTFDRGKRQLHCRKVDRADGSCDSSKVRAGPRSIVMDQALVQDDGIGLITADLDRCWEVTQDQDKASKIVKALHETPRNRDPRQKPLSCLTSHGRSSTFYSWKTRWEFHCQR